MKPKKIKEQEKIEKHSKNRYKIKNNRGVTIVALVISIIVMLLLAGTTINLTMKGDGIFSHALNGREKQQISQYEEKIELARGSVALENLGEVTLDNLIEQIYEEKIVPEQAITKLDEEKAKVVTKEGYVFVITAKKADYEGKGEEYDTPPEIQEGDISFSINPDTWTNGNIKVEIKNNIGGEFTLKYSYNGMDWTNYTAELEIENNMEVYACLENKLGEKSNVSSCAVTKIDKIDPQNFTPSITSTTNSITVDASNAKDGEATSKYGESGIKEIWYSDDAGTTWETNEEDKTNTKYTFEELIQGKEYEVQVKVIDNAGNQIITKAQKITTSTITGLTITVEDADTWTNGTKRVTITAANSNYSTIRYTTDGSVPTTSSTEYIKEFTVEKNCTITAVAFDSTNQAGTSAINTVTKIDTLAPTGSIEVSTTTNTATVEVTAQDQEATSINGISGIKGYYYSKDGGSTYTVITTATSYTFEGLTQTKDYIFKVKVEDNAGNQTVLSSTGTTSTVSGLTVSVEDADTWTSGTKTITITATDNNYSTIRYTLDGTTPTTSSTAYTKAFTVDKNCTITAVAFDSTNQVGATASNTVTKIDKLAPATGTATGSVSVTTTTNSATVTVSATDQAKTSTNGMSGIKGYYYSKDGGSTYTSITTATSYTFQSLTQTKQYSFKVKVEDNAGNQTVLSSTGTTGTVAGLTVSVGNADTWTNGTKTITITAANSNYSTIRYTLDGTTPTTSSTAYTKAFTVDKNCTITAVAFDSTNQVGATASNTVTKIDKLAPATGTATGSVSVTTTTNSAQVTVTAADQAATSASGNSGIKGYYYSKDGGSTYTSITTATSYTFSSLTQTKQYSFKVKVEDNAGNQTVLSGTGTTNTVAGLTITVGNADTWSKTTKTVTITAANSNYSTIRYTLDGTTPTTSSTAYTKAFTVSSNCTITAVAFDSTNQVGLAATNTVTKIDKLAPATGTATGSVSVTTTTNSATVTVSATDQAKTSTNGMSGIKGYYYSKDGGSSYTAITTATSYTFSSLTQTQSYSFKVKVEDNAGNQTVLSSTGTTSTVSGLTVSVANADTWTNGTKTITITAANSNYSTIRYTLDGTTPTTSSTAYTKAFTVSSNCTITAVAFDSTNQVGATASNTVTKIEKTVPQMVSITNSAVSWSGATGTVTITGKAKDVNSGIIAYQFSTNASLTATSSGWTTITATTAEISKTYNVTATGTYYFYVKDQAGNINKNSVAVTISDTTKPAISLTADTTETANSVTLTGTSQDTESGIVGYAFTTTETQPTSWTAVTQTISEISKTYTITSNATVYFWTKDGKGNVNSASCKVTNIVSKVSITSYSGVTIIVGNTATPTLTYTGTAKSKTFSSSNTTVATINATTGLVTAKAAGTATMTVTLTNYDGTTVTKICTVTVKEPVSLSTVAQPGDYVQYDGGNGYTGLWQVLYNDDTYGLQIISVDTVTDSFTLGGSNLTRIKETYNNVVDTLNTECEKYVNTSYATSGRCVGSNPLNPDDAITDTVILQFAYNGSTASGCKVADTNYETDYNAMKAATSQNTAGIHYINKSYWLASRYVDSGSKYADFYIRFVGDGGVAEKFYLLFLFYNGSWEGDSSSMGLRPVITLKSGIKTSSGTGTSSAPYVLVAQ